MLDRKKLFVDIKSVYRGSRVRGYEESDRLDSPLIAKSGQNNSQPPLDIETPSLDIIEDQVEEAAHFFLDQPTPDLEMRSNLTTNPLTPFLTASSTTATNSSTASVIAHSQQEPSQLPVIIKQEPLDLDTSSTSHNNFQPPRYSRMDSQELYNDYPEFLLEDQQTPQVQQTQHEDSLSTPVINPNFSGNPFANFSRLPHQTMLQQRHSLPMLVTEIPAVHGRRQTESWTAPSTTAYDDGSFTDETASFPASHHHHHPSMSGHHESFAPSSQSMDSLNHHHHHAAALSSQLPESVMEQSFGRPSSVSSHVLIQPYSPSGSSDLSSQVPSPTGAGSRSGSFSQDGSNKRKRSTSDEGGNRGKSGRPTKKQQLDMLCNRKKTLESQNHQLREDVAGYERACRRLKDMLYQRIREQRA